MLMKKDTSFPKPVRNKIDNTGESS